MPWGACTVARVHPTLLLFQSPDHFPLAHPPLVHYSPTLLLIILILLLILLLLLFLQI